MCDCCNCCIKLNVELDHYIDVVIGIEVDFACCNWNGSRACILMNRYIEIGCCSCILYFRMEWTKFCILEWNWIFVFQYEMEWILYFGMEWIFCYLKAKRMFNFVLGMLNFDCTWNDLGLNALKLIMLDCNWNVALDAIQICSQVWMLE